MKFQASVEEWSVTKNQVSSVFLSWTVKTPVAVPLSAISLQKPKAVASVGLSTSTSRSATVRLPIRPGVEKRDIYDSSIACLPRRSDPPEIQRVRSEFQ